jgi:uncharacterized protein YndB with AHSA1/START domain
MWLRFPAGRPIIRNRRVARRPDTTVRGRRTITEAGWRQAPTIDTEATMADIIHRIGIRAPAAKVYDAVATARGVAGWWTRETTGTAGAGGKVNARFHKDGKEIGWTDFTMTRLEPAREVHWRILDGPPEWVGTDVTFELAEDGEMTILNFGHRGWREPVEFMAHCSMKWAAFLLSLRELVETGTGRPSPDDLKIDDWN